jgi:Uma2 family endonuclease
MTFAIERLHPPVRVSSPDPLSREEFWRLAADYRDLRMEREANGDIRIMTPTKRTTGSRNNYISTMLGIWTYGDGRGDCFDSSTGFDLPDDSVLSPDASWVSFGRLKAADAVGEDSPLCPEFVIELRSKSDSLTEVRAKMGAWLAHGCELGWLIDPSRKAVEIYRPGREPEVLEGASAVEGEGPVAGFVLELGRIWA